MYFGFLIFLLIMLNKHQSSQITVSLPRSYSNKLILSNNKINRTKFNFFKFLKNNQTNLQKNFHITKNKSRFYVKQISNRNYLNYLKNNYDYLGIDSYANSISTKQDVSKKHNIITYPSETLHFQSGSYRTNPYHHAYNFYFHPTYRNPNVAQENTYIWFRKSKNLRKFKYKPHLWTKLEIENCCKLSLNQNIYLFSVH